MPVEGKVNDLIVNKTEMKISNWGNLFQFILNHIDT